MKIDNLSTVVLLSEITQNYRGRELDCREGDLVESAQTCVTPLRHISSILVATEMLP